MTSKIVPGNVDGLFPTAGQDNSSQGFRDNFSAILTNFTEAKSEIEALQTNKASLNATSDFNDNEVRRPKIKDASEVQNSFNEINSILAKAVKKGILKKQYMARKLSSLSNQIKKNSQKQFKIIGSIAAGSKPLKKKIKKFDAVEIMTGGIIPKGFDTIIPIEQINFYPNKKNKKYILIDQKIKKYDHVRFAGSDYKKGEVVIKKNTIVHTRSFLRG